METKHTEMFTIDAYDLDVEELEERLELAALFASNASSAGDKQTVDIDWGCACNGHTCTCS